MSRCIIPLLCIYSSAINIHAMKNSSMNLLLAFFSLNLRCQAMWYLRSPPVRRSMARYRFSRSWKANLMLTMKLGWGGLRVVEFGEDELFVHHTFDTSLHDDPRFRHLFHCVLLLRLLVLHAPHLAKPASPHCEVVCEVALLESYVRALPTMLSLEMLGLKVQFPIADKYYLYFWQEAKAIGILFLITFK